jgi:OOP family OmpA-OmpF porin/outer membrane immunogenic protein
MNQSNALRLALALGLVTAGIDALAADTGAWIGAGIGAANIEHDGMGTANAYDIAVGYRWNGFGVEAGYNDFATFERDLRATDGSLHRHSIDLDGWSIGLADRVALDARWYVTARAGLFRWNTRFLYGPADGARDTYSDKGTDWYGGVGVGYRVSERFGVGVNVDYLKAQGHNHLDYTTTRASLRAEYAF